MYIKRENADAYYEQLNREIEEELSNIKLDEIPDEMQQGEIDQLNRQLFLTKKAKSLIRDNGDGFIRYDIDENDPDSEELKIHIEHSTHTIFMRTVAQHGLQDSHGDI